MIDYLILIALIVGFLAIVPSFKIAGGILATFFGIGLAIAAIIGLLYLIFSFKNEA